MGKPVPRLSPINSQYFEAAARGRFQVQRCSRCRQYVYYPRAACPHCLATEGLVWEQVSGEGVVYSFALIHRPQHPAFAGKVPIPLAAVKLQEGPLVISAIVNCTPEAIAIDMPVRVVTRRVTPEIGLPYFEPVGET